MLTTVATRVSMAVVALTLTATTAVWGSNAAMCAPSRPGHHQHRSANADGTAHLLLQAIHFFQQRISSVDGARCQFYPTCSAYGYQAIQQRGAWQGLILTADRLMRCGYLTDSRAYPRTASGRLYDPLPQAVSEQPWHE